MRGPEKGEYHVDSRWAGTHVSRISRALACRSHSTIYIYISLRERESARGLDWPRMMHIAYGQLNVPITLITTCPQRGLGFNVIFPRRHRHHKCHCKCPQCVTKFPETCVHAHAHNLQSGIRQVRHRKTEIVCWNSEKTSWKSLKNSSAFSLGQNIGGTVLLTRKHRERLKIEQRRLLRWLTPAVVPVVGMLGSSPT